MAWPESQLPGWALARCPLQNSNSFDSPKQTDVISLSEFDSIQVDMTLPAAVEFFTSRCDLIFQYEDQRHIFEYQYIDIQRRASELM